MTMPDLQRKLESLNELDIHVFVSLNLLFSFVVSLHKGSSHFLIIRNNEENQRNKHYSGQKNDIIFLFFD